MALEKSIEILSIQKVASLDDLSDVVTHMRFSRVGKDGDDVVRMNGMVELPSPDSDNFVEISKITEEMAIKWVADNHDMAHFDSMLEEKIERLKGEVALPWVEETPAPSDSEEASEEAPAEEETEE